MATTPGQMTLLDIKSRVLHLLFEPGPDTGTTPVPVAGDFSASTLTRDANIVLGTFIGLTGISPSLSEVRATQNITAGLDFTLPANCSSLVRIEYTPAGQYPYTLVGKSFDEFDSTTGGIVPPATGQPYYYRTPFANVIRFQPQPGPGNAGQASGLLTLSGVPAAGNTVTITLVNGGTTVVVGPYVVLNTDSLPSISAALAALINASAAVVGGAAFLAPATVPLAGQNISLTALVAGTAGNAFTYSGATTGAVKISPTATTQFGGGRIADTITLYYESLGTILVADTDVPGIPPQFHMAIPYGMLADYWMRKGDAAQADRYERKFGAMVKQAMSYQFDVDRSTQPTLAGEDVDVNYADGIVG